MEALQIMVFIGKGLLDAFGLTNSLVAFISAILFLMLVKKGIDIFRG